MILTAKQQIETPVAAVIFVAAFCAIVGAWYLFKNRRKIGRKLRKMTRRKDFWGYVTAAVLFVGFGAFFIFLDFRY